MSVHEQFAEDLALHALGALDGPERQTLETHLEGCASCRRELELLRGDASLLALTTAGPQPPARSRQRLMSAIAAEPRMPAVMPASERPQYSWRSAFGWPAVRWGAAIALIVVCIGLLRQNATLQQNVDSLRAQFADQGSKLEEANQTVATLLDPESTKIELISEPLQRLERHRDPEQPHSACGCRARRSSAFVLPRLGIALGSSAIQLRIDSS